MLGNIDISQIVTDWIATHGIRVAAIIIGAYIVQRIIAIFIDRAVRAAVVSRRFASKEAEKKREDTLIDIFRGALTVVIWIIAGMMILQEFGLDIGPMLAAAGIAGIALGFGGQYFIKDLISGLFIIMENQYRVGDVVCFEQTCGLVENISVRMTTLRDLNGTVHHVPHGEIKTVSNLTKDFAKVNLNIGIAYDSNLEKVIKVVDKVGEDLAKDAEWKKSIISAPKFSRVNDFADSAIIIKILGETYPMKQWAVAGELRKRIKIAFDKEGIEIPFPQRVIHESKS